MVCNQPSRGIHHTDGMRRDSYILNLFMTPEEYDKVSSFIQFASRMQQSDPANRILAVGAMQVM